MKSERRFVEIKAIRGKKGSPSEEEDADFLGSYSDRKAISVIFPRGEAIRNFAYSGTLDSLNEEFGVHLITVDPGFEFRTILEDKCDRLYQLPEYNERWVVNILRELLDTAHNRWLWSRAAKERSRLRDKEAKTVRQKVIRSTKKLISFPIANKPGLRMLSKLERASSRLLRTADTYLDLFRALTPALVFNASHVHSRNAIQAVQAANWLGIPTATFIFSWDNLTSQGRIILPYDYFLVWNETLKSQLLEMYDWIRPENVFVTGSPQFDFHFRPEFYLSREKFCARVGADSDRPIVFYATGMPNHMPGEPAIVEGIADILNEFPIEKRPQLLVRVYAKDLSGRFDEMKARRPDILFPNVEWEPEWLTPKYEDSYALVNTLRHCAVGINVASTVSLELCMFDKPVINIGYNPPGIQESELSYADYYEFDHYKPVVDSGAVRVAWNDGEIRSLITASLRDPSVGSIERRNLIDEMFGSTMDGKSAVRVSDVLLELAKSGIPRALPKTTIGL